MNVFFKIISVIFHPLLISTYGMLWMLNLTVFSLFPFQWQMLAIGGTTLFTCIIPLLPTYILMRQGAISDLQMQEKEQRTMPYVFSIVGYSFWTVFLSRTLQLPMTIAVMGVGSVLALVVIMIVNFKWKISAHLCGMGSLFGFVSGLSYVMAKNPIGLLAVLLCLSALVALARIELKAHTPLQTLVGFVVGLVCVFGSCFLMINL